MSELGTLRSDVLENLRENVRVNLPMYRVGDFQFLEADQSLTFKSDKTIELKGLCALHPPTGSGSSRKVYDFENCQVLHTIFKDLSAYEARDERIWVYVSHTAMLTHARSRWPIPDDDDKAVAYIRRHFFARDKRQVERENVASRLWWMTHLCYRVTSMHPEDALRSFLYQSDVRANIMERPTSSQVSKLFEEILRLLDKSYKENKLLFERSNFRTLMSEINSIGGYKLLDCLPSDEISKLLESVVATKLELKGL